MNIKLLFTCLTENEILELRSLIKDKYKGYTLIDDVIVNGKISARLRGALGVLKLDYRYIEEISRIDVLRCRGIGIKTVDEFTEFMKNPIYYE